MVPPPSHQQMCHLYTINVGKVPHHSTLTARIPDRQQMWRLYTINVRKLLHLSTLDLAGTSMALESPVPSQ